MPVLEHCKSAISALDHSNQFPNIGLLIQLLGTIPVTTSGVERVYSKMDMTLTTILLAMEEDNLEALLLQ